MFVKRDARTIIEVIRRDIPQQHVSAVKTRVSPSSYTAHENIHQSFLSVKDGSIAKNAWESNIHTIYYGIYIWQGDSRSQKLIIMVIIRHYVYITFIYLDYYQYQNITRFYKRWQRELVKTFESILTRLIHMEIRTNIFGIRHTI